MNVFFVLRCMQINTFIEIKKRNRIYDMIIFLISHIHCSVLARETRNHECVTYRTILFLRDKKHIFPRPSYVALHHKKNKKLFEPCVPRYVFVFFNNNNIPTKDHAFQPLNHIKTYFVKRL